MVGYIKLLSNSRSIIVLYSSKRSKLSSICLIPDYLDKYTHVVNPIAVKNYMMRFVKRSFYFCDNHINQSFSLVYANPKRRIMP